MDDDIVQELHDWQHIVDESKGDAVVVMLSGQVFGDAADEISRLRDDLNEEREISKTFEMLLRDANDEIERLTKERNGWQAEAAGISEDLSNAEDEIERLQEEINDLRLQVVTLSIPKKVSDD